MMTLKKIKMIVEFLIDKLLSSSLTKKREFFLVFIILKNCVKNFKGIPDYKVSKIF